MATKSTPLTRVERRVVRVFVSSTFRDMVEERDELLQFKLGSDQAK